MFLVHHEILGMVDVVRVWVFNPDPKWFASLAMSAIVPLEIAEHLEHNAQNGARDRLN